MDHTSFGMGIGSISNVRTRKIMNLVLSLRLMVLISRTRSKLLKMDRKRSANLEVFNYHPTSSHTVIDGRATKMTIWAFKAGNNPGLRSLKRISIGLELNFRFHDITPDDALGAGLQVVLVKNVVRARTTYSDSHEMLATTFLSSLCPSFDRPTPIVPFSLLQQPKTNYVASLVTLLRTSAWMQLLPPSYSDSKSCFMVLPLTRRNEHDKNVSEMSGASTVLLNNEEPSLMNKAKSNARPADVGQGGQTRILAIRTVTFTYLFSPCEASQHRTQESLNSLFWMRDDCDLDRARNMAFGQRFVRCSDLGEIYISLNEDDWCIQYRLSILFMGVDPLLESKYIPGTEIGDAFSPYVLRQTIFWTVAYTTAKNASNNPAGIVESENLERREER
ncbi:hypothetical protein F5880DRAFT_1501428 [Lentinula raphanica]|nr:hypothetical protein F5880DRAFT_1501428 [Lentinula raphanica]